MCYISSVFTDPYFTDRWETLVTISPVSGVTVLTAVAGGRSCMNSMWDSRRLKNNTTAFHCQRYFKAGSQNMKPEIWNPSQSFCNSNMHLTPDYFTVFIALKFNWLNSWVKWFSSLKQALLFYFNSVLSFLGPYCGCDCRKVFIKEKKVNNAYVACSLNYRDSAGFIFTGFKKHVAWRVSKASFGGW